MCVSMRSGRRRMCLRYSKVKVLMPNENSIPSVSPVVHMCVGSFTAVHNSFSWCHYDNLLHWASTTSAVVIKVSCTKSEVESSWYYPQWKNSVNGHTGVSKQWLWWLWLQCVSRFRHTWTHSLDWSILGTSGNLDGVSRVTAFEDKVFVALVLCRWIFFLLITNCRQSFVK